VVLYSCLLLRLFLALPAMNPLHPIEVWYFDNIAGEALEIFIAGPGVPKQIITAKFIK